jgi:hypothetical protein
MQAIAALVEASAGHDTVRASMSLAELLNSLNTDERLIAYRSLAAIKSRLITSYGIGRNFVVDIVPSDGPPLIYVSQVGMPRIALIGGSFSLPAGALYISPDRLLTVSAAETPPAAAPQASGTSPQVVTASSVGNTTASDDANQAVTLYWRSPFGDRNVSLKTSPDLPHLIARMAYLPDPMSKDFDPTEPYIGANFQRVSEMLASLCHDQTLNAQFMMQKSPPGLLTTEEIINGGRPEGSTAPTTQPGSLSDTPAPPATMPAR